MYVSIVHVWKILWYIWANITAQIDSETPRIRAHRLACKSRLQLQVILRWNLYTKSPKRCTAYNPYIVRIVDVCTTFGSQTIYLLQVQLQMWFLCSITMFTSFSLPDITGRTALAVRPDVRIRQISCHNKCYTQHCMDLQLAVDPYKKTCALWKHGLTSKNTQSQLTYFCKSNINQTFTNGSVMIWGVRIAIFTEIRHLVEELITFLSIFGLQKWGILTPRLN